MNGVNFIPVSGFILIVLLISVKTFTLKKRGTSVSSGTGHNKKHAPYLYLFFGIILLIWVFEISKDVTHPRFQILPAFFTQNLVDSAILKVSGSLFVTIALILLLVTLVNFKNSLRFGLNKNNRGTLITSGIFSFSRNPFFLSLNFYFTGTAFIFPNLFFIGFALLAQVSTHFFILKEEKFMLKIYGDEYKKYTRKVRRYF